MSINIIQLHHPLQFITVRGGVWNEGEFEQDWCNHGGAGFEELTFNGGLDNERTEEVLVCDKCDAQFIGTEWVS